MAARIGDVSDVLLYLGITNTPTALERAIANVSLKRAEAAIRRYLHYDPAQETRTEYYPQIDRKPYGREGIWESTADEAYLRFSVEFDEDELQLKHIPVRSVTSLHIDYDGRSGAKDDSFPASSARTEGTDFWPNYDMLDSSGAKVCSDGILRSIGGWPSTPGTIKIVYVAGYTEAELRGDDEVIDASNILEAVIDEAVRRCKKAFSRMKSTAGIGTGPFSSESLGDYSYSVDTSILARLVGGTTDLMPETMHKLQNHVNYGISMV